MGVIAAARYVLSIPTNRLLIGSSALGYFFFAGLATFLVTFVEGQYHVGPAETSLILLLLVIASVIGTLVSGRVTDALVRRGAVEARMWVPAVCYIAATVVFIPGVLGHSVTPALWFDIAGAALLSAANPPLDAARLDIMPAPLWGRAESTRTVVRSLAQALAPIVFGLMADLINGAHLEEAPIGTHAHTRHPPQRPRARVHLPDHARDAGRGRLVHAARPPHLRRRHRGRRGVAGGRGRPWARVAERSTSSGSPRRGRSCTSTARRCTAPSPSTPRSRASSRPTHRSTTCSTTRRCERR